jgi:phage terminase large subunit GpA-like protein
MIAQTERFAALLDEFVAAAKSEATRTMREFAEAEIYMPQDGGPYQGQRFSVDFQPVAGLIFDAVGSGEFSEYYLAGPSQSGKTFTAFVVPLLYQMAELGRNVVVGVPDANMADDKYRVDIEPILRESPTLRDLLPRSGPGSKGGKIKNTVTLHNGAVAKWMTPFGDDSNKAGFTAGIVCVTEAARFSQASETSVEANPLRQLMARQRSQSRFDEDGSVNIERQMVVEGTMTVPSELPESARARSTDSRIVCQCHKCRRWLTPERADLVGWQDATSDLEAAKQARFKCSKCGVLWTEQQRRKMNRNAKLIHAGQSVDKRGRVIGQPPNVARFFLKWNAFNNLFATAADIALEEWTAAQLEEGSRERIDAEKDLCQSIWAIPFEGDENAETLPKLKPKDVEKRRAGFAMNTLPPDTTHVSVGVDVGRRQCWFVVLAARENGTLHCPLYGRQDTSLLNENEITPESELQAISLALMELYDFLETSLIRSGSGDSVPPDVCFVDAGYRPEAIYRFCRALHGGGPMPFRSRYFPIVGRGQTQRDRFNYAAPKRLGKTVRRIGNGWHMSYEPARKAWSMVLDADRFKLNAQEAVRIEAGKPGALCFFDAPPNEHNLISRHLSSEILVEVADPVGGVQRVWRKSGRNHLLDCTGYALAALDFVGYDVTQFSAATDSQEPSEDASATKKPAGLLSGLKNATAKSI